MSTLLSKRILRCLSHAVRSRISTASLASSSKGNAKDGGRDWEGKVVLWGNGDFGRLGNDRTASMMVPTISPSLASISASQVACGGAHTVILSTDGRVFCMGLNDNGQVAQPTEVPYIQVPVEVQGLRAKARFVAAGHFHTACITEDGELWTWGGGREGQLGHSEEEAGGPGYTWRPTQVRALAGANLRQVACGAAHTLALTEGGEVYSWGQSERGRLGHGPFPTARNFFRRRNRIEWMPRRVQAFDGMQITKVAAGHQHSACIDQESELFTFGYGAYGQLGTGRSEDADIPTQVGVSIRFHDVALGGNHSASVSDRGDIFVWGANEYGCLGLGPTSRDSTRTPRILEGPLSKYTASQISCGWKHTAAVTANGELWAWGWGGSHGTFSADGFSTGGQLGLANEFDYLEPTRVRYFWPMDEEDHERGACEPPLDSLRPLRVVQLSCGMNHTAAILASEEDL